MKKLLKLKITKTCIGCGSCEALCPQQSIICKNKKYVIDTWSCSLCELCISVCPADSIKIEDLESTENNNSTSKK